MLTNLIHNTKPIAVHAPGQWSYNPAWQLISRRLFINQWSITEFPQDISIITWNGGINNYKALGMVEKSLKWLHVPYANLKQSNWHTNRLKISLTVDFLKTITTPYIMGMDSSDTLLFPNYKQIINLFLSFNTKLLFNAEMLYWPQDYRLDLKEFEIQLINEPQKHLNCGLWLGDTKFCKEFFIEALYNAQIIKEHPYSEQVCIKPLYQKYYPLVKIDSCNLLFQNLNRIPIDWFDL